MAELAASIIGIVSAGTKVTLVLSQLAADVGSAAKEARMIASEIRSFCAVVKTLGDTLEKVQSSHYYAHCTEMTKDMTDASLEMFTEILKASEDVLKISRGKDGKFGLKGRMQWAMFQKPKITLLRVALEAYKSNLALMLGTLNTAEKVTRRMTLQITPDVIAEDEKDRAVLQSLVNEHRASLIDVNQLHRQLEEEGDGWKSEEVELAEEQSSPTEPPEGASDVGLTFPSDSYKDSLFESARMEIDSIRTSLSRRPTFDCNMVHEQVSRYSKTLSQLMSEDQHRISQRWSSVLAPDFLEQMEQGAPTLPSHLDPRCASSWAFQLSLDEQNPQSTHLNSRHPTPQTILPPLPVIPAIAPPKPLPTLPSFDLGSGKRSSILSDNFYAVVRAWLMGKPSDDRRTILGTLMNEVCPAAPRSPEGDKPPHQARSPWSDAGVDREKGKEIKRIVQQQMREFLERARAAGAVDGTPLTDLPGVTIDLGRLDLDTLPYPIIDATHQILERFSLSNNRFTKLPRELTMCQRLRYLNIRRNRFETIPPPVLELPLMEILDISRNELTDIPEEISKLQKLKVLAFSKNKITRLPYALGNLSQLKIIKYDGNPIASSLAGVESRVDSQSSGRIGEDQDRMAVGVTAFLKTYMQTESRKAHRSSGDKYFYGGLSEYGTPSSRYPVVPSTPPASSTAWNSKSNFKEIPQLDRKSQLASTVWGEMSIDFQPPSRLLSALGTTAPSRSEKSTKAAGASQLLLSQKPETTSSGNGSVSPKRFDSPSKDAAHQRSHSQNPSNGRETELGPATDIALRRRTLLDVPSGASKRRSMLLHPTSFSHSSQTLPPDQLYGHDGSSSADNMISPVEKSVPARGTPIPEFEHLGTPPPELAHILEP